MEVIYEHDRRLANCDDSDLFQLMEPVDVLDTESDVSRQRLHCDDLFANLLFANICFHNF